MKETKDPLHYHRFPQPGKVGTSLIRPLEDPSALALAYSPGVAEACKAIAKDPLQAMHLTCRQSLVAVISNGTAVLGLGDLGPLASTPVMEGKAMLFMEYGKLNAINLQINEKDPQKLATIIASLAPSFAGINLEDIKAPECFIVEDLLKRLLAKKSFPQGNPFRQLGDGETGSPHSGNAVLEDCLSIPVFHDDQHGTAITVAAALTNALFLVKKPLESIRCVVSGAGASALATLRLLHLLGLPHQNVWVFDSQGFIHPGRSGLSSRKQLYAHPLDEKDLEKNLEQALVEADVFLGMSKGNVLKPHWLLAMNPRPIIFALANPEPEIHPRDIYPVRPDAIVSTGRSDYPNQVNNVLCFPYIFRAALDTGSYTINDDMMLACSKGIGKLAQKGFCDIHGHRDVPPFKSFGQDFFIPFPFDTRLLETVPLAVAEAAVRSGVASPSFCLKSYGKRLVDLAYQSFPMVGALKKKHLSCHGDILQSSQPENSFPTEKGFPKKWKKLFWVMGSCPKKNVAFMTAALFFHQENLASVTCVTSKHFEDSEFFQLQTQGVFSGIEFISPQQFCPSLEDVVLWSEAPTHPHSPNTFSHDTFYIQQEIINLSTAATMPKVVLWNVLGALPDKLESLQAFIQSMGYRHVSVLKDFMPCEHVPFDIVASLPLFPWENTLYLRFFKEKPVLFSQEASILEDLFGNAISGDHLCVDLALDPRIPTYAGVPSTSPANVSSSKATFERSFMKKMEPFMVTPGCHWQRVLAPSISDIIEKGAFSLLNAYRD